jgi:signal transduction histidine kinase
VTQAHDRDRLLTEAGARLEQLRNVSLPSDAADEARTLAQEVHDKIQSVMVDRRYKQKGVSDELTESIDRAATFATGANRSLAQAQANVTRATHVLTSVTLEPLAEKNKKITTERSKANNTLTATRQRVDAAKSLIDESLPTAAVIGERTRTLNETFVPQLRARSAQLDEQVKEVRTQPTGATAHADT